MSPARPSIGYLLLEAFFVVLAVGLAWGVNEWRMHALEQRQAHDTINSLTEELSANRAAVQDSYEYHTLLLDTLQTLVRLDAPATGTVFQRGFLARETPLHAAWDAAQASGRLSYVADHLGQDTVLQYAALYQRQQIYLDQKSLVGQLIYERLLDDGFFAFVRNYRNYTQIVGSISFLEYELLNAYNTLLPDSIAVTHPFTR